MTQLSNAVAVGCWWLGQFAPGSQPWRGLSWCAVGVEEDEHGAFVIAAGGVGGGSCSRL